MRFALTLSAIFVVGPVMAANQKWCSQLTDAKDVKQFYCKQQQMDILKVDGESAGEMMRRCSGRARLANNAVEAKMWACDPASGPAVKKETACVKKACNISPQAQKDCKVFLGKLTECDKLK
ncbi:hypothetical protein HDE_07866 [Halotydeus destructor]|nr:hypothetical protein HDE_07866 [Halotydeus destructor]